MVRDATLVADPFHVTKLANTKARRVPTPGAERDPRSSGPQVRSPLSLPAPVDQGQGAARRQRPREAHRPPSCRRSPRRCGHPLAGQGGRARALCTRRSRPRPRVGHPATTSWTRTRDRGPRAPTNPALLEALDCRPAPAHVSNGPTEAIKNFIKRVARAAFGFMSFRDYPIFFPGAPVPAFPRGIPPTPRRCAAETHQPQSPRKRPVFLRDRGGGALAETWW